MSSSSRAFVRENSSCSKQSIKVFVQWQSLSPDRLNWNELIPSEWSLSSLSKQRAAQTIPEITLSTPIMLDSWMFIGRCFLATMTWYSLTDAWMSISVTSWMQEQFLHKCISLFSRQQSPPSNSQLSVFSLSSQIPSPILWLNLLQALSMFAFVVFWSAFSGFLLPPRLLER